MARTHKFFSFQSPNISVSSWLLPSPLLSLVPRMSLFLVKKQFTFLTTMAWSWNRTVEPNVTFWLLHSFRCSSSASFGRESPLLICLFIYACYMDWHRLWFIIEWALLLLVWRGQHPPWDRELTPSGDYVSWFQAKDLTPQDYLWCASVCHWLEM